MKSMKTGSVSVQGYSGRGPADLAHRLLGTVSGATVLDLAAGGGHFAKEMSQNGAISQGADIRDQWQYPEIPFQIADLDEPLTFEEESFDAVTFLEALNYVESPARLFREVYRIVKPGGQFVVTFPNCLCFESRLRYLVNGTYRWFPHPTYSGGGKGEYGDIGRDPIRPTTAVFHAQMAGFELESVEYGGSHIKPLKLAMASPFALMTAVHNRLRAKKGKCVPAFACSMDSLKYRTVGFRARKPKTK